MPSWNNIFDKIQPLNALEEEKKKYFKKLRHLTKRNYIVYFSCWQQKPAINDNFGIDDNDRNGFMNALHNLKKEEGLDLILHTPGGDLSATQSIINYLCDFFNYDIRVIVPHTAMSAGTMIACSAKEIVMGRHSNLGPIDPQISGVPANEFIKLFNNALKDLQANKNITYWTMILQKYPPTFQGICENAIEVSKKYVTSWIKNARQTDLPDDKVKATVDYLSNYNYHLQHNSRLNINELKTNTILNIKALEENQEFQDAILSLYHCYTLLANISNCTKILENHNSIKYVKNHN